MDALTLFMSAASALTTSAPDTLGPDATSSSISAAPSNAAFLLATTVRTIDSGLIMGDEACAGASGALTASRRILAACHSGAVATTETGELHGAATSAAISALEEVVSIYAVKCRRYA